MGSVPIETVFYFFEAITVISLVSVIVYLWRQAQKTKHQRHARKVIESLGLKFLQNVVLPDGVDGLAFIDYLLLVPDGFVVLDVHHIEGHLFGGESVDQWSQVINNKTYKFPNPLYANQSKCQAVLWNLQHNIAPEDGHANKEWQAHGWVAFSNIGNFPKGIPAQVSMIDDLKDNLATSTIHANRDTGATEETGSTPAIEQHLQQAWEALHNLSISTSADAAR